VHSYNMAECQLCHTYNTEEDIEHNLERCKACTALLNLAELSSDDSEWTLSSSSDPDSESTDSEEDEEAEWSDDITS
jgi:hypothetical protein